MSEQQHYDPTLVEQEAQTFWSENKTFEVTEDDEKEKILLPRYVSLS